MQLDWLEDFLAVIKCGSFSGAAELRGVSQPTLSRRVQSLEEWLAVTLFERTVRSLALTSSGERFHPIAEETVRRLYLGKLEAQEEAQTASDSLRFSATYALALSYFPAWWRSFETQHPLSRTVQLAAATMDQCVKAMLNGKAHFLMCYHHQAVPTSLDTAQFLHVAIGSDTLIPACACNSQNSNEPLFALPGSSKSPLPYLAYSDSSGIGNILSAVRSSLLAKAHLTTNFVSHSATALASMARGGRGIAWVPLSMIDDDLRLGRLVRAGAPAWDVPLEICLFRPRATLTRAAEQFWEQLTS